MHFSDVQTIFDTQKIPKSRAVVSTGAVAPELFEESLNKNLGFMGY